MPMPRADAAAVRRRGAAGCRRARRWRRAPATRARRAKRLTKPLDRGGARCGAGSGRRRRAPGAARARPPATVRTIGPSPASQIEEPRGPRREQELRHRLGHQVDEHAGAGEAAAETPRLVSRRAPTKSPPTWATGSSVLMPSRTKRSVDAVPQGRTIGLGKDHEPAEAGPGRPRRRARDDDDQGTPTGAHDRGGHIFQARRTGTGRRPCTDRRSGPRSSDVSWSPFDRPPR